MILILIGVIILIAIIIQASSRAEEGTSEKLCRASNGIRYGTKIDSGPISLNTAPRACKTIDKGDLPSKNYKEHIGGEKEGAKAEIDDMIAKCWYMWLEGKQPNMFDTSTVGQNKCFICYTFSLGKNVDTIKSSDIFESLEKPYYAVDKSDNCAGAGGFCRALCGPAETEISSLSASKKCSIGAKCCISKKINNECENRAGRCESTPLKGYYHYEKWKCNSGDCYVDRKNMVSYIDYIQGTNGALGGAGFLLLENTIYSEGIQNRQKYALTLVSPGNDMSWDTAAWGGATLAGTAAFFASIIYVPPIFGAKTTAAQISAAGTAYSLGMISKSGNIAGYNFIYLSDYDKVQDKCAVEQGVDVR